MKYELYAYRPAIGVAVCKRGDQWLLVEPFHEEGETELISEKASLHFAEQLGLVNMSRVFSDFSQLKAFLTNEYIAANSLNGNGEADDSVEALLDFMDQATVLKIIDDIQLQEENQNPRKAIELLEAIEAHPKYLDDIVVLAKLNPLKQTFKKRIGKARLAPKKKLSNVLEAENKFNVLNGRLAYLQSALTNFSSVSAFT